MTEVVVTTGAIRRAKLQSNCHHQQTNIQFFTGRMPFLSPSQHCWITEEKLDYLSKLGKFFCATGPADSACYLCIYAYVSVSGFLFVFLNEVF